jgi:hypothetical protein
MTTGRINQVSILSNPDLDSWLTHDPPPELTLPSRARVIDWMCVFWAPRAG